MTDIQKKIDAMFKLTKKLPNFDFSKSGCRVEFVSMNDPYHSLERGSKGTIIYIHNSDPMSRVLVIEWDNGHQISLIEGKDNYHITPKEESK
tara:strand:+ start:45 stop:320 length:276 start_codon:yes stop_codon:yes gene_type:complete